MRNQDDEFNFRMIQNRLSIWLHPSIKLYYHPKSSLISLFKQYYGYGFYKIRVFQKRKGFASIRHLIPLIFVISFGAAFLLFLFKKNIIVLLMLITVYLSFSLIFTIYEAVKKRRLGNFILFLPLCYITLHLSYGLGSLIGLIYFSKRWNDTSLKDEFFNKKLFYNLGE